MLHVKQLCRYLLLYLLSNSIRLIVLLLWVLIRGYHFVYFSQVINISLSNSISSFCLALMSTGSRLTTAGRWRSRAMSTGSYVISTRMIKWSILYITMTVNIPVVLPNLLFWALLVIHVRCSVSQCWGVIIPDRYTDSWLNTK